VIKPLEEAHPALRAAGLATQRLSGSIEIAELLTGPLAGLCLGQARCQELPCPAVEVEPDLLLDVPGHVLPEGSPEAYDPTRYPRLPAAHAVSASRT
jgi:hypothetical protein